MQTFMRACTHISLVYKLINTHTKRKTGHASLSLCTRWSVEREEQRTDDEPERKEKDRTGGAGGR